jgi:hypothetical protein
MRGVTVTELEEFHDHFNGATSRDMQEQMMREQAADGMEGMSYFEWWVLPRRRLREQEEQHGLLPPNAVVSYSWEMPWDILIEYLKDHVPANGTVWIDILACDQHAIAKGDMKEIQKLPSVIEYIGQTFVMPGALSRLWCIFEMAYSLRHNKQLLYYNRAAGGNKVVRRLLRRDKRQLRLPSKQLLENADCNKVSDKRHILSVIDRNFDSRGDAVDTIKAFVETRIAGVEDEDEHRDDEDSEAAAATPRGGSKGGSASSSMRLLGSARELVRSMNSNRANRNCKRNGNTEMGEVV